MRKKISDLLDMLIVVGFLLIMGYFAAAGSYLMTQGLLAKDWGKVFHFLFWMPVSILFMGCLLGHVLRVWEPGTRERKRLQVIRKWLHFVFLDPGFFSYWPDRVFEGVEPPCSWKE